MTFPPQSSTAIATTCLFFSAQDAHASTRARAPALEITLMFRVICCADRSAAAETTNSRQSGSSKNRLRMESSSEFGSFRIPTLRNGVKLKLPSSAEEGSLGIRRQLQNSLAYALGSLEVVRAAGKFNGLN